MENLKMGSLKDKILSKTENIKAEADEAKAEKVEVKQPKKRKK